MTLIGGPDEGLQQIREHRLMQLRADNGQVGHSADAGQKSY